MTNEQSTTLFRLNKQAQMVALNAVGFSDITESFRVSEFGQHIRWAVDLFSLNLIYNRILDNSKWYSTRKERGPFTITNKQSFIKRGLHIRAYERPFVVSTQECYNTDMTIIPYWGGQGKTVDGLNQKGLSTVYDCFTSEGGTDLIIATLKGQNNSGVIGTPATEATRTYRAYALGSDGAEGESNWFLPSSGQMLLMYHYHDKINKVVHTSWSSDSMLMTNKYCWSSTIWDTNSAWAFELSIGRIMDQNKNSAPLHVRAVASRQY